MSGTPADWPALPGRVDVLVTVLTYDGTAHCDLLTYCTRLYGQMVAHPRLNKLEVGHSSGYPTDRMRNAVVKGARDRGFHFLLMLDDDQVPDLLLGKEPGAKPFLPTSLDFALAQPGPVFVGAPYCAAPPAQEVVVMKNREYAPDTPGGAGYAIDKYTRDEAAVMTGITRVSALPTGCLLVDLRAFDRIAPPWFAYEYADPPFNSELASTEDVVLTRNADWLGVPQFANWDAWAGHRKPYLVGKPRLCPVDDVPRAVWRAFEAGWRPKHLTD